MAEALQVVRTRSRAAVLVTAVVVGTLLALAVPASAHTLEVEGVTSCPGSDHVVTWTIHNHETASTRTMTIAGATATVNGQTYAVTGYDTTVAPAGQTNASSTVPGDVTGTITITVRVRWADGFTGRTTGSVLLEPPCNETSTTTTSTSTTSTTQPTTTTQPSTSTTGPSTTTSPPVTGGTAPTSAPPSSGVQDIEGGPTTVAGSATLPRTGEDSQPWAFAGVVAFALGLALLALTSKRTKPGYSRR